MKKYGILLILFLISHTAFGQGMDKLFDKFAKSEHVTHVTVGPFLMKISSCFASTMGVNKIEVLDLNECSPQVRNELATQFKKINDPKFETLASVNETDNHTKVLVRTEEKTIRELIIFITGADNALVRIQGKIKPEDLDRVVKKHGNGC